MINNFGDNINLEISARRQRDANQSELKYILFWNEAYGSKEYDLGFGREPFYDNLCEETRCYATDNRDLKPVEEFDAVFFHQRSLDFHDVPKKRDPSQRYVHYIMESAQYLYMDISSMNNFFNWTMTYRRDSDFFRPYGRIVQVRLVSIIRKSFLISKFCEISVAWNAQITLHSAKTVQFLVNRKQTF